MSEPTATTPNRSPTENPPASEGAPVGRVDLKPDTVTDKARELGGPQGPEPTRYGDWERGGRCIDF